MSNPFKDLIKKTAAKAQETFNIDEAKTEKFIKAADQIIDKTASKIEEFEKSTNGFEGDLKSRFLRAKDALMNKDTEPKADEPKAQKTTAKKSTPKKP